MSDDMQDEEELQAILEAAPVDPFDETDVLFYESEETGEFWQWHVNPIRATVLGRGGHVRVQERVAKDGQVEQRVRECFDNGTYGEWSVWYSALESWAVKRGHREQQWTGEFVD